MSDLPPLSVTEARQHPAALAYPLEWIRDVWSPAADWKRTVRSKEVTRELRNYVYLSSVRQCQAAMVNRIAAQDAVWAEKYARAAAHYALIYLRGEL